MTTGSGRPYEGGSDETEIEPPPSSPRPSRGSDATELERPPSLPRTPPPGYALGSERTQLEHPPTPPPGFAPPPEYPPHNPPGARAYPEPPSTGPGSPPPPPAFPGYGYAPPPQPPSRGRRPALAVGGVALAVLVIAAGVGIFVARGRGDSAGASPTPGASTAADATRAALVPPGMATPAALSVATAAPPALSGPTDVWTDPENRISVRFPTSWEKATFDTRGENATLQDAQPLVELTGPDLVRVSVSIYVSTATLDDDVRAFLSAAGGDPQLALVADPTQDVTVGGEPSKLVTGTYMRSGAPVAVAVWFADHAGKRFGISADRIGAHRGEVDAIVGTVSFLAPGAQAPATPARTPAASQTATSTIATATRPATVLATTASLFGTATATSAGPLRTTLTVTLKDASYVVSPGPLQAGPVAITIENTGTAPYTVEFHGNGTNFVSPSVAPGQAIRISLTFAAGTYTIIGNVPRPVTNTVTVR